MKHIAVLGSTGSIGKNTLKVAEHLPDSLQVVALAAHSNVSLLAEQIEHFQPEIVAIYDQSKVKELKQRFPHIQIVSGEEGLLEVARYSKVDFVVVAIVGTAALAPTIASIQAGKNIGLANKEVMVSAGKLIRTLVEKHNTALLPIDSEHNALFQCLEGKKKEEVARLILTASGGPFRSWNMEKLKCVTLDEALAHPTWNMGPKVTIDSSNLMNKGLEMIEASYLFDIPAEKIEIVVHPQSIIHSMIEMIDGCILAEMSQPSMIYPIQHVLTYPQRERGMFPLFDFRKASSLDFFPPDTQRFPAPLLAHAALKEGGSFPCYLNAANEVLVQRFLKKEISWISIIQLLEKLLSRHSRESIESLEAVLSIDNQARQEALQVS